MIPAVTLSLTAQGLQLASAVIVQQMRLADAVIDQAFVTQRVLMGDYPTRPVGKLPSVMKAAAKPASKAKPAKKSARPTPTEVEVSPKVAAAPAKRTAPAKPPVIAKAKAVPATAPKKVAPAKAHAVATAPKAKSATKAKTLVTGKATAPKVDAKPKPLAEGVPAPKARGKKPAKKVTVADAPWSANSAPKS